VARTILQSAAMEQFEVRDWLAVNGAALEASNRRFPFLMTSTTLSPGSEQHLEAVSSL